MLIVQWISNATRALCRRKTASLLHDGDGVERAVDVLAEGARHGYELLVRIGNIYILSLSRLKEGRVYPW
jgi:hypothetical protein